MNKIHINRSKPSKKINIPLSKILMVLAIIFVLRYFSNMGKQSESDEDGGTQNSDTAALVETESKQNPKQKQKGESVFTSRNAKITHADLTKLLEQYPPKLTQDRDTVKWQRGEVVRHFSIDTVMQRRTQTLLNRANARYAAAVAINPETGQILALVSYTEITQPKIADNLCLSAKFPAASIIKTITAQAAFENSDVATTTEFSFPGRSTTLYRSQFIPLEFGANTTTMTFAEAYARSANPVFGWLAVHRIGRRKLAEAAQKFGFNAKIPFELAADVSVFPDMTPDNINDTINIAELGSGYTNETTLTPLLGALIVSSVVNRGDMMVPTLVDSVVDKSGRKLYSANTRKWKKTTAHDIADSIIILKRRTARSGSARTTFAEARKKYLRRESAVISGGKTGTKSSQLGRNEWFTGFAKDTLHNFSIATSVVITQNPKFIFRPSHISAEMMYEYMRRIARNLPTPETPPPVVETRHALSEPETPQTPPPVVETRPEQSAAQTPPPPAETRPEQPAPETPPPVVETRPEQPAPETPPPVVETRHALSDPDPDHETQDPQETGEEENDDEQ